MNIKLNVLRETINVRCHLISKTVPNIIFIMTPITSVNNDMAEKFYKSLKKNYNIFCFDFIGIGNSTGSPRSINYKSIKDAFIELLKYVKETYGDEIHVYGGTGTGGIIAQGLVSDINEIKIKTFTQYGVANYKDMSIMGNSRVFMMLNPVINGMAKILPNLKYIFNIPQYTGYNASKEEEWYRNVLKNNPGCFDMQLPLVAMILNLFFSKSSSLKMMQKIPTLVIAAKYDRYFSIKYVEKYYNSLTVKKMIHWIDDSHLCFDWKENELSSHVDNWIKENRTTTAST